MAKLPRVHEIKMEMDAGPMVDAIQAIESAAIRCRDALDELHASWNRLPKAVRDQMVKGGWE